MLRPPGLYRLPVVFYQTPNDMVGKQEGEMPLDSCITFCATVLFSYQSHDKQMTEVMFIMALNIPYTFLLLVAVNQFLSIWYLW